MIDERLALSKLALNAQGMPSLPVAGAMAVVGLVVALLLGTQLIDSGGSGDDADPPSTESTQSTAPASPTEPANETIDVPDVRGSSQADAEAFYAVHKERPFFNDLVAFMTSGPIVLQVLEGEGAVAKNREVMGATNPADAAPGTIRAEFAESVGENSVHGSDAPDTAAQEIAYFFSGLELVG